MSNFLIKARAAWSALHSQLNPTPQWYGTWLEMIPREGCNCNAHWTEITKWFPPDFRSPAHFHWWAINAHNLVNERLAKPLWPNSGSAITPAVASLLLNRTVLHTLPSDVVRELNMIVSSTPTSGKNSVSGN